MSAQDRLADVYQGLQERLEGQLRGNRAAVTHPGARGEAAEDDWLRMLKEHLPHRYQADRAFVIDATGACSDQIDVVIYDRQYSPLLYNQAGQRYIPAESVYAVIEVKQELNRDHVQYAGKKAASVRRLSRTSATIPYAAGSYGPRSLPSIIGGLVAYRSSWSPPLGQPLTDALVELPEECRLELGCSLVDGAFEVDYTADQECRLRLASEFPLVQFLLRLLRRLQAAGTVPAVDYAAYLNEFESQA